MFRIESYDIGSPLAAEAYSAIDTAFDYRSIWQSPEWHTLLSDSGITSDSRVFVTYSESGEPTAYCAVDLRSLGAGELGGFCIGGPRVRPDLAETDSLKCLSEMSESATEWVRSNGGLFLQFEPLDESVAAGLPGYSDSYKRYLEPYTIRIDLSQTEEEILADMKQKGRYNIRLAEKSGVTVRAGKPEELPVFLDILRQTLDRDGFSGNSDKYYAQLLRWLSDRNAGGLYFAERDGVVISAAITSYFGSTAIYYYGASVSDNAVRKYMASYALQWEMIREAQSRGCKWYDFLGIAPPDSVWHKLSGVTDFKRKFASAEHAWPSSRIIVIRTFRYSVFRLGRSLRRLIRSGFTF